MFKLTLEDGTTVIVEPKTLLSVLPHIPATMPITATVAEAYSISYRFNISYPVMMYGAQRVTEVAPV